ncbi:jupiter microtubule associated homolog 2 [Lampris incognitus]|uniref:jupiter microtubule associated homolog 2 n=1 Tax=Lampris incognitus TaxID=2546036 RepID=UPI0024B4FA21|nr:jupiter microtubule associated homolog 2 [Lampris incognitus]
MTSTNMFQGLGSNSKPSSRVLRPPGGGSSNLFGGYEEDAAASRRPNKMASTIFAPVAETQEVPKRSNPPGGKSSGIFGEPEAPAQQLKPVPPGGPSNNIFGGAGDTSLPCPARSHPNKPKDNLSVGPEPEPPAQAPPANIIQTEVKEEIVLPPATPPKEEPAVVPTCPEPSPSSPPAQHSEKNHEPHLGPKPRSHNRVLNPPGGKSSVVFY